MNGLVPFLPLAFPLFFAGTWCLVLRILSLVSGWPELAKRFHHPEKFHGKWYRFQSGRLNLVGFNNGLDMGVNQHGFYLVPMILFRPFHKPLLIPWSEIHAEPFSSLWYQGYRLTLQSMPSFTLDLRAKTFESMIEYLETQTGVCDHPNPDTPAVAP